jgi:tetratricopeptide (TPR) repeat protein
VQRADYDRLSREGGAEEDEQAKVQQVLRAVTAFQKAEVLARRGDWAGVEKLAEQACEDDPEQAEYAALLAYARSRVGRHAPDYSDVLGLLNPAVDREPKNTRIKLYRAQVLKQAGKMNEAIRDFRAVVEADPANVDAQRELRLYKMRRGEAPGEIKAEQPGGLLGRWFGKD